MHEEKALQQVLSRGTKGAHPLMRLPDDLTGTVAIWLGWHSGTLPCCRLTSSQGSERQAEAAEGM